MSSEGNLWREDVRTGYIFSPTIPSLPSQNTRQLQEALQKNTLSPIWQESVFRFWCLSPPKPILYDILKQDYPISAQVLAIDVLSCKPEVDDLPILWNVFFASRFGIRAEDPDLFSRSLRLIVQIEKQHPNSHNSLLAEYIPSLWVDAVQHRDGDTLQQKTIAALLDAYYTRYGVAGLESFSSEGGSVFQDLIDTARTETPSIPQLPKNKPGQYPHQAQPAFHATRVKEYTASFHIPILVWGIGLLICSVLLYKKHKRRMAALMMSCGIMVSCEGGLMIWDAPILAEQQPLFSFIDFSYHPYNTVVRDQQLWWVSNGGAARWQEIPKNDEIFRIAVLGASSAHGSNLLQEESFSFLLEKKLQQEFPRKPIQVVNMGIGGTLSNGILSAGSQAIDMGADAIIVYYGHNEVSQFQQLEEIGLPTGLSSQLWLSHLRTYTILYNILSPWFPVQSAESSPPPKSLSTQRIVDWAAYNHYQNLSLLFSKCRQKNISILQITPTYNFRFAPFQAAQKSSSVESREILNNAKYLRTQSKEKALLEAQKAQKNSSWGSDVALEAIELQAHLHAELGQKKQARQQYQKLFDQSQEITTIHSQIKNNIQRLASEFGTAHFDAEDVFYHHSQDGITANGLFWDEIHPSVQGHQYLAEAIIPWARKQTSTFHEQVPNH